MAANGVPGYQQLDEKLQLSVGVDVTTAYNT